MNNLVNNIMLFCFNKSNELTRSKENYTIPNKKEYFNIVKGIVSKNSGQLISVRNDELLSIFQIEDNEDVNFPLLAASKILKTIESRNKTKNAEERINIACYIVGVNLSSESFFDKYPLSQEIEGSTRISELCGSMQIICESKVVELSKDLSSHFAFGNIEQRYIDEKKYLLLSTLKWKNNCNQSIKFLKPKYKSNGFLTLDFILDKARLANNSFRFTGLSNRLFSGNIDLFNIISNKIKDNPEFEFEMIFLNPYSNFKTYSEYITRRHVKDLGPGIINNLNEVCSLYTGMGKNVTITCSDFPMIIPQVQMDNLVYFSVPFRSDAKSEKREGVVGGGYFYCEIKKALKVAFDV